MEVKRIAKQPRHLLWLKESCFSAEKVNTGLNQDKGLLDGYDGKVKGEQSKY